MGKIYNLYLDESETHDEKDGNWINKVFCIAGIIVEDKYDCNELTKDLNKIKYQIWKDNINYEALILHEVEIKQANNGYDKKNQNLVKPHNRIFRKNQNVKILYRGLEKIIRNKKITTLAVCIKHDELDKLYNKEIQNDRTLMALQILIENYVHFLKNNDSKGRIIYEHNGDSNSKIMKMKFNMIKTMGTLFINPYAIQERLLDIEFPSKDENIAGLQIADFIPNIIARKVSNKKLNKYNIYNT
ncbi:TPA: DUF3800 domain-containing protein, partial [Clostridioides difficile]|nr:DUF3800 domain-containing protein [Clostridioides difficile]